MQYILLFASVVGLYNLRSYQLYPYLALIHPAQDLLPQSPWSCKAGSNLQAAHLFIFLVVHSFLSNCHM